MALLCGLSGWGFQLYLELELFMLVGISGASLCFFFYLMSRRTLLKVGLEDGSSLDMAVRNKHFAQASQFANIVCRVCTHWEPPRPSISVEPSIPSISKAQIEIEDLEDLEDLEESEEPTVEVSKPPPAGWLKLEEPAAS